jgi:hypothetical protein
MDSDVHKEIRVGLKNVKATSVNPDQLGTDTWELSERKPSTVYADPSKLRIWGGDKSNLGLIMPR